MSSQAQLYSRGAQQVSSKQGSSEEETFKATTLGFVPQGFVTMGVHTFGLRLVCVRCAKTARTSLHPQQLKAAALGVLQEFVTPSSALSFRGHLS